MPPAKRKPRSRSSNRRSRRDGAFSFSSFIGGVVLGGAVVLAITYRSETTSADPANPAASPIGPVASNIDWEFVNILPNAVVKTGVAPVEQPPAKDAGPKEYVLHAAQFLREEDARVMLAELMLDGMPVTLKSSPRNQGGAWHQVMVGPYATEPDAQEALGLLRDRDIPAQMLTRPLSGAPPTT